MARVPVLPVWFRGVAVVTAGIVEDTLFLGYSFTRSALITGNQWLATYFVAIGLGEELLRLAPGPSREHHRAHDRRRHALGPVFAGHR